MSCPPPKAALPDGCSSANGSVSVRCLGLHGRSAAFDAMSSVLSLFMRLANRLNVGRLSMGVGGFAGPPIAKLPKFPIGDIVPLVTGAPHGDAGPLPSALPAVLLRIKPPNGSPVLGSSGRSSVPSLDSGNFRAEKGDDSSLEKRLIDGEDTPDTESVVCCLRVLGRLVTGDESPKLPEPCDTEVLRPFSPCTFGSLEF